MPDGDHEDWIEKLAPPFYIRWTSGPNYERAFLCVEDGEPDMRDFATVSFGMAAIFKAGLAASYQLGDTPRLRRTLTYVGLQLIAIENVVPIAKEAQNVILGALKNPPEPEPKSFPLYPDDGGLNEPKREFHNTTFDMIRENFLSPKSV